MRALAVVLALGGGAWGCTDYPAKVAAHGDDATTENDTSADTSGDTTVEVDTVPTLHELPCSVQQFLVERCASCHGATPVGDAPMSLLTYDDLLEPSRIDPTKNLAQVSVSRMRNANKPMPPAPTVLAEAEIQAFADWVAAGMQGETCSDPLPPDPFGGPTVCTSGQSWNPNADDDARMFPGRDCIGCHAREGEGEAPVFHVAGTIYPTGHEPDSCYGVGTLSGVKVEVVDSAGRKYMLAPNGTGNFYLEQRVSTPFTPPYRARLITNGGAVRQMVGEQDDGDCNACHTAGGTSDAPGRIVIPW